MILDCKDHSPARFGRHRCTLESFVTVASRVPSELHDTWQTSPLCCNVATSSAWVQATHCALVLLCFMLYCMLVLPTHGSSHMSPHLELIRSATQLPNGHSIPSGSCHILGRLSICHRRPANVCDAAAAQVRDRLPGHGAAGVAEHLRRALPLLRASSNYIRHLTHQQVKGSRMLMMPHLRALPGASQQHGGQTRAGLPPAKGACRVGSLPQRQTAAPTPRQAPPLPLSTPCS